MRTDSSWHVHGHIAAGVQIPLVLGQQVNIVKHKALPVAARQPQRLQEAHVHEQRSIELQALPRLHHKHRIVELLPRQKGVHVLDEQPQLRLAVAVRNDEGHSELGAAVGPAVAARADRQVAQKVGDGFVAVLVQVHWYSSVFSHRLDFGGNEREGV